MRYHLLGRTGLFVSELCLGAMSFGTTTGRYAAGVGVTQDEANALVRRALDAGINFLDTANVYTDGQSEEILGRAIQQLGLSRHQLVLATKAVHAVGPGPNDQGASRYHLVQQVQASLKRLGTDHIDLYQLHGWDPATPVEETLRALDDLVRQGLVRYVGVSNWAAWQIAKALGVSARLHTERIQSVQAYYSLVGRELEREIVPVVEAEQLALLVYSPLAGGYLSGKYRAGENQGRRTSIPFPPVDEQKGAGVLAALDEVAARHDASQATMALAWLRHQPAVTRIILGVKRLAQLEENLLAAQFTLSADDLLMLATVSASVTEYPGWAMTMGEAARRELLTSGHLPKTH